jgi:hypothetical protein
MKMKERWEKLQKTEAGKSLDVNQFDYIII